MASCVEETKHMRRVPHLLGIHGHHWLRALPKKGVPTMRMIAILTQTIYRCDCSSQFEDWSSFKKHNESAKRKRKDAGNKLLGITAGKLQLEPLLSRLATEHFRAVVSLDEVHSVPSTMLGITVAPLRQHLAAPVVPVRPSSASADMVLDTEDEVFDCTFQTPAGGAERFARFCRADASREHQGFKPQSVQIGDLMWALPGPAGGPAGPGQAQIRSPA